MDCPIAYATLMPVVSNHPKAPEYRVIVEMADGTEWSTGVWPKTQRDGTPITYRDQPVLGGKKWESGNSGQKRNPPPQQTREPDIDADDLNF